MASRRDHFGIDIVMWTATRADTWHVSDVLSRNGSEEMCFHQALVTEIHDSGSGTRLASRGPEAARHVLSSHVMVTRHVAPGPVHVSARVSLLSHQASAHLGLLLVRVSVFDHPVLSDEAFPTDIASEGLLSRV